MIFDQGDPNNPRGHALVYFTVSTEPEKVYSSYIVILPLKSDLSKYVPPFLASTLGEIPTDNFTSFSMPPAPEDNYTLQELQILATNRSDDLINGGSIFSYDVTRLMELVNNTVQEYSSSYSWVLSNDQISSNVGSTGSLLSSVGFSLTDLVESYYKPEKSKSKNRRRGRNSDPEPEKEDMEINNPIIKSIFVWAHSFSEKSLSCTQSATLFNLSVTRLLSTTQLIMDGTKCRPIPITAKRMR